jgi:hypothetical protein
MKVDAEAEEIEAVGHFTTPLITLLHHKRHSLYYAYTTYTGFITDER